MARDYQLGVMFRCTNPPHLLQDYVRRAESAGFDEVWLVEDCFFGGGISSAAVALAATGRIRVGLGIMPAVARNAAFTAMEIATLARLYPGRFLPGIGHGVGTWMRQIGAFPQSQLAALEEVSAAVRALLAGDSVSMDEQHVYLDTVKLEFPPEQIPPVSLGVRGPKSLQLSGRVADGTILAEYAAPAYVRWSREQIRAGQADADREGDPHRLTVYTFGAVNDDGRAALDKLRPRIAAGLGSGHINMQLEPLGILPQIERMIADQGLAGMERNMPEDWIRQLAVAGTPDECHAALTTLAEAGADSIVLVPEDDDDLAQLEAFARLVD